MNSGPGSIWWVHPRKRGGAACIDPRYVFILGPSPQARGSPFPMGTVAGSQGSIPASAGEPSL